jgi:hypothetical protein
MVVPSLHEAVGHHRLPLLPIFRLADSQVKVTTEGTLAETGRGKMEPMQ